MSHFFTQTPRRKAQFKTMFPDIALPPQPIHTRWGTWIEAVIYYATYFEQISDFLAQLDPEDAVSISKAQTAIAKANIKKDLAFIKTNFECLVVTITKIQERGTSLSDAINLFDAIKPKLASLGKRQEFLKKYNQVADKNKGLAVLRKISKVLNGEELDEPDEFIDKLTPTQLAAFNRAPVVSADVERTFNFYKKVLDDGRRSFTLDNLIKHVILHVNVFD